MPENTFTKRLLAWYGAQARDLPWRGLEDPYAIWVSEVMLQQTRVETAIPYFQRWMGRFPTLPTLAEAAEEEVLRLWEGLGYYRRARYLHQAAQIVMEKYQGTLPRDPESLQELPGIGPYTAAAIASIAFDVDVPAVDGNAGRVLSRVFNVDTPLYTAKGKREIRTLAREHLPPGSASSYNQALMDLGSSICTPQTPDCTRCPLDDLCQANALGNQEERPVLRDREPNPHHIVTAAVIQENGEVLLTKRPPDALLGGLWEFPGGKLKEGESLSESLTREIQEELSVQIHTQEKIGTFQHAYTHYKITLHAYHCALQSRDIQLTFHTDWKWVPIDALQDFPMGKVDRLIAQQLQAPND
ncbi:MAG: A/G-specific adenine glycosylase [Anaerolineales bacterium]